MLTQTSNKEKKKQICKLTSPRFENPSSRVDTIKHQMRKPKKKKKKEKNKNREANKEAMRYRDTVVRVG